MGEALISSHSMPMHRPPRRSGSGVLPVALTPLIGRERELAISDALLQRAEVRLLTITGPGGIGKTRLALEVGRAQLTRYPANVVFVPLAVVSDPEEVPTAIIHALGASNIIGVAKRDHLVAELREASMLLILDNFEHLMVAAPLLTDVLTTCPAIKIVTTSRSLLRVAGEYALPVPPLMLPDPHGVSTRETITRSPAVQLFVARAQAVSPSFVLTDEIAPLVSEICQRIDGLPLAIELTAAQLVVLPPDALLHRLRTRLPLPVSGPRDAPARLRSIADATAWSYDLLTADEQRLFRYLSVFTGGLALDAAEMVCGTEPVGSDASAGSRPSSNTLVLNGIASLVEKSLLRQVGWEGEARFEMLETIRSFAWGQLVASGEADAIRDAHASWVMTVAEPAELAPELPGREHHLRRLEIEHANMLAALDWLERRENTGLLLHITAALSGFWLAYGHFRVGRDWLERALARPSTASKAVRGRAQMSLGWLLALSGETERADHLLAEGMAEQSPETDVAMIAFGLVRRSTVALQIRDAQRAEDLLNQALALAPMIPETMVAGTLTATVVANLGVIAHGQGDLDLAQTRYEEGLRLYRAFGHAHGTSRALRDLGDLYRDRGDFVDSQARYRESVDVLGEQTEVRVVVDALEGLALAATAYQLPAQAARLLGAAEELRELYANARFSVADRAAHERTQAAIRETLAHDAIEAARRAGQQLSISQAIAEIMTFSLPENSTTSRRVSSSGLSPRETEVLRFLVAGLPDREIAEALFISVRTVEAHVARILAKLGVRTRTAAVSAAIAAKLVDPTPTP